MFAKMAPQRRLTRKWSSASTMSAAPLDTSVVCYAKLASDRGCGERMVSSDRDRPELALPRSVRRRSLLLSPIDGALDERSLRF